MINPLTQKPYVPQPKQCGKCNNNIYDTDVTGYSYVCLHCNENLYECETQ